MHLLSSEPFDIRKEVAYVLGNLCVAPAKGSGQPSIILRHLVTLVKHGCLPGFINLVRSADIESARLGLQFLELVSKIHLPIFSGLCFVCYSDNFRMLLSHLFCLLLLFWFMDVFM